MSALRTWLISCAVLISCFGIVGNSAFAQIDNKDNPLTAEKHAWAAHEVAVIGLSDASNEDGGQEDALINVIKWWVNWVLGVLALIALIILMYGWLLMVTAAGNEERYGKGRTILKQAAIGLVVIGLAWFVVSIIFWLVNVTSEWVEWAGTGE